MAEFDLDTVIGSGDSAFTLSSLADISFEDIAEVRTGPIPQGVYHLQIESCDFGKVESNKNNQEKEFFKITYVCKVIEPIKLLNASNVDAETLKDRKVTVQFMGEPDKAAETLGQVKAFLVDSGFQGSGNLLDVIKNQAIGHEFQGRVKHRTNKNDTSQVFTEISRDKAHLAPIG